MKFNPKNKIGKIKPMHAVNNGPIKGRGDQTRGNFNAYKEAGIPYARNHDASHSSSYGGCHCVDVNCVFTDFSKDVNDPSAYDFACTDKCIKETLDAGTETFYRLGASIEHWIKKYNTLPPADFNKWAQICEHIIRHYNEGWADGFNYNIQYWEIWNEPDLDEDDNPNKRTWGGTKAQFFDLYEVAAKHLKSCFPNLKIGGPALAHREEWADDFLAEMKKRNVPMDFFSWHIYCVTPEQLIEKSERIKAIMDKNGYGDAESILNEWNYVKGWSEEFVYSIEQIIGLKGAAFTASCMLASQDSTIDLLMYYDARPCAFNGMFDIYTFRPLKGYYPFLMFNELYKAGEQIECVNEDENIYAVGAVASDGKVKLMIAYYTDDDNVKEAKEVEVSVEGLGNVELNKFLVDENTNGEAGTVKLDSAGTVKISMTPNSFVLFSN